MSDAPSNAFDSPPRRALADRALALALTWLVGLGPLLLCAACDGGGGDDAARAPGSADAAAARREAERLAAPAGTEERDLAELVEAFTPLDATVTSDVQDRWLLHQRDVQERLRRGGPALGLRALQAFREHEEEAGSVRSAYLDIAAHCAPATTAPVLEELIVTYHGGTLLRVRTEAVRLLAETSPRRALEFLEPLVLDERPHNTRPAQEALMDGWARAAQALGVKEARVPAGVATNLFQPADARYRAIQFLGGSGTPLARSALQELFVEATSDGMIRRKAAQAMAECLPADELCPILVQVSEHESDMHFLNFLADMIDRHCGG